MKNVRLIQFTALSAVAAVYIGSRLWGLNASCLWFDEIFSLHAAGHAWSSLFSFVAQDLIHPPLFYILLKIWIAIGGEGLVWLRLLPVVFAVLAIAPFLLITNEFKLRFWQKFVALFLFAVNGSLIKYSQELRMYSLLLFLSLTSIWLFARYFQKGKSFVLLVIVNVLLIYCHYFGWLVVGAEVLAILIFQRIKMRAMFLMLGISIVSFLPWAVAVWQAAQGGASVGQNIGWMQRPGIFQILQLVFGLIEPFYFQASSAEPFTKFLITLPFVLLLAGGITAAFVMKKDDRPDNLPALRLLVLFIAFPVISAFIASWIFPYSFWGTRHLIIVFAPVLLLIGIIVGGIEKPVVRTVIVSLIVLLSALAFTLQLRRDPPNYIWCAWEPLAVKAAETSHVKIYVFEDLIAYHVWNALRPYGGIEVEKISDLEGVKEDTAYFLPRGFSEVKTITIGQLNEPRLWIAYRGERIDESKLPLKTFLDLGYRVADRKVVAANTGSALLVLLEK